MGVFLCNEFFSASALPSFMFDPLEIACIFIADLALDGRAAVFIFSTGGACQDGRKWSITMVIVSPSSRVGLVVTGL